jgi:hypothetical protein
MWAAWYSHLRPHLPCRSTIRHNYQDFQVWPQIRTTHHEMLQLIRLKTRLIEQQIKTDSKSPRDKKSVWPSIHQVLKPSFVREIVLFDESSQFAVTLVGISHRHWPEFHNRAVLWEGVARLRECMTRKCASFGLKMSSIPYCTARPGTVCLEGERGDFREIGAISIIPNWNEQPRPGQYPKWIAWG